RHWAVIYLPTRQTACLSIFGTIASYILYLYNLRGCRCICGAALWLRFGVKWTNLGMASRRESGFIQPVYTGVVLDWTNCPHGQPGNEVKAPPGAVPSVYAARCRTGLFGFHCSHQKVSEKIRRIPG